MSDAYVERVAGELADLALADERRTHDQSIIDQIGELLGSSSQTLQEAYLTAVRVRRAEKRARELLIERGGDATVHSSRMISDNSDTDAPRERGKVFEREREPDGTLDAVQEPDAMTSSGPAQQPAPEVEIELQADVETQIEDEQEVAEQEAPPAEDAENDADDFEAALARNIAELTELASSKPTKPDASSVKPGRPKR